MSPSGINNREKTGLELDIHLAAPLVSLLFVIVVILICLSFSTGFVVGTNRQLRSPGWRWVNAKTQHAGIEAIVQTSSSSALKFHDSPTPIKRAPSSQADTPSKLDTESQSIAFTSGKPAIPDPTRKQTQHGRRFLQVLACKRSSATVAARSLAMSGFRTTVIQGPKLDLFRVLVGPLDDDGSSASNRLRAAGFLNVFVRKY
jgi:cell division protein FtsN